MQAHPIHIVAAWLGNTPKIALKHYLMATDADFDLAIKGGAESGAVAVQNAVQHAHAVNRTDSQETTQAPAE